MMKPVLGIDFGTTNTCAAWVDAGGQLHMVAVRENATTLPSIVWYDGKGSVLVGGAAREMAVDDPPHTVFGFKRFLGRRHASDFVHRHKDRFSFPIVAGQDGNAAVLVHGRVHSLEETTFHVLGRILELANAAAGRPFEECVLTVPAHFGYRQRKSLRRAAEMAGLEIKAMVNEPTAAALYYLQQTGIEDTLLIFDLGGGTFDATLLSVKRGLIEILATSGDAFLGGADFDGRLVDHLVERYRADSGIDLRHDPVVMQRLTFAAEAAKIQLTSQESTRVAVRCVAMVQGGGGSDDQRFVDLEYDVTRAELEAVVAPLIEKCLGICEEILARGARAREQVGGIIFVGGQTRMPALRNRLKGAFKYDPARQPDPEMAVCAGAAILGRGLHVMVDVVPMSIGLMLPGGVSQEVISPSSVVPCVRRVALTRPAAGTPLVMAVYEAVTSTATERELLGSAKVDAGWLALNPGELSLEVRMGREFDLQLFVHPKGGARAPVELKSPA